MQASSEGSVLNSSIPQGCLLITQLLNLALGPDLGKGWSDLGKGCPTSFPSLWCGQQGQLHEQPQEASLENEEVWDLKSGDS